MLTVPVVEFPPVTPLTSHVTAVLLEPVTVAVNCCVALGARATEVGEIVTLTDCTCVVADAGLEFALVPPASTACTT